MSGRDPLPREQAYEGVRAVNPPEVVISKGVNSRNPTVNDKKYRISTIWVNSTLNTVFMFTSVTAAGNATWTQLS